jgi:hypothetical protein
MGFYNFTKIFTYKLQELVSLDLFNLDYLILAKDLFGKLKINGRI